MKQIALVILVVSFSMTAVFAQGHRRGHKHHPKLNKEAKEALELFRKEKIYPVKKAAHDQFLTFLSEEDRLFLEEKKAENKRLHEEMKALHKEMKGLKESGKTREEMYEIRKEKFSPIREKRRAFMESMKPFMERNQSLVSNAMTEMKGHKEEWEKQRAAILEQYLTAEEKEKMEAHKTKRAERRAQRGKETRGDRRKKVGAVKFVLWDGKFKTRKDCKGKKCDKKDANASLEEGTSTSKIMDTQQQSFVVNNYPNPAITQTTILLELTEVVTKVKVTIADAQGKQVWLRQYNKLDAGEHKIDVNLRKFTNGQYFYTVEIGDEKITKTLVVNQ